MQERYPDLPPVNAEELAELITLKQIVEHLSPPLNGGNGKHAPIVENVAPIIIEEPLPAHHIQRSTVRLKSLPRPDFAEFILPAGYICLVMDDGSAATLRLTQRLQERGWHTVVLSLPGYIVPSQIQWPPMSPRIVLSDLSETHLQEQLAGIANQYGPVGAFIHLSPTRQNQGASYAEADKAMVKHVFLIAKHLKKSLNEAAQRGQGGFLTVTRLDGALGTEQSQMFSAVDGGLFGLTKTLNLEWPSVYCRAIDLSPSLEAEQVANHILAELHDPNRLLTEVGYNLEGRVTLVGSKE